MVEVMRSWCHRQSCVPAPKQVVAVVTWHSQYAALHRQEEHFAMAALREEVMFKNLVITGDFASSPSVNNLIQRK